MGGGDVDGDEEGCNHHIPADSPVEDGSGYHAPGYYDFGVAHLFGHR